jgi:hypothetical protein
MYHEDTEMLFPMRVASTLGELRGVGWKRLVERVLTLEEDNPDALAFGLMMVRLSGCLSCQADSFRALRGCTACGRQAIMRYRGTDQELLRTYEKARKEVQVYLEKTRRSEEQREDAHAKT